MTKPPMATKFTGICCPLKVLGDNSCVPGVELLKTKTHPAESSAQMNRVKKLQKYAVISY